jgi:tetratricopeptide (TPR) repeat protein
MGRYGIDWGNSEDDLTENDYNTIFVETSKIISLKTTETSEVLAAFYNRGNIFQNRGEYQKAILDYSSAIELQNDFLTQLYPHVFFYQ